MVLKSCLQQVVPQELVKNIAETENALASSCVLILGTTGSSLIHSCSSSRIRIRAVVFATLP